MAAQSEMAPEDRVRFATRAILLGAVASGVVTVLGVEVLSLEQAIRPLPASLLLAATITTGVAVGRRASG